MWLVLHEGSSVLNPQPGEARMRNASIGNQCRWGFELTISIVLGRDTVPNH